MKGLYDELYSKEMVFNKVKGQMFLCGILIFVLETMSLYDIPYAIEDDIKLARDTLFKDADRYGLKYIAQVRKYLKKVNIDTEVSYNFDGVNYKLISLKVSYKNLSYTLSR